MIPVGKLYTDQSRSAGEIAGNDPAEMITSHVAQGNVPFGLAVSMGSQPENGKIVAGAGDVVLGVAGLSSQASDIENEQYSDGDPLAVVRRGVVVVHVSEAVNPSSPVRVRHTNGTGGLAGSLAGMFGTSADAGRTARVRNAMFMETTTGAGLVALWVVGPLEMTADA